MKAFSKEETSIKSFCNRQANVITLCLINAIVGGGGIEILAPDGAVIEEQLNELDMMLSPILT